MDSRTYQRTVDRLMADRPTGYEPSWKVWAGLVLGAAVGAGWVFVLPTLW